MNDKNFRNAGNAFIIIGIAIMLWVIIISKM